MVHIKVPIHEVYLSLVSLGVAEMMPNTTRGESVLHESLNVGIDVIAELLVAPDNVFLPPFTSSRLDERNI